MGEYQLKFQDSNDNNAHTHNAAITVTKSNLAKEAMRQSVVKKQAVKPQGAIISHLNHLSNT